MRRRIGSLEVSAIGLGCMGLSHAYGVPPSPRDAEALLLRALDGGATLFDTAALYGFGANEELVGRVLGPHRGRLVLASKGGMTGIDGKRVIDGRPESLRRDCEASLRRLRTDVIDLYYLHRWDRRVPIEDSVGALKDLVAAGKVREIGLSEVSATTLRRAHTVHPVAAVQSEYSLWTRNPEIAVLAACRELGATLVAFSPLGRGFLADAVHDASALAAGDLRRAMPRFQPGNLEANLALLEPLRVLAAATRRTPAQLALAWLLGRGAEVVPIPGTVDPRHLDDNLAAAGIGLDPRTAAELAAALAPQRVAGERYAAATQLEIDTETFG